MRILHVTWFLDVEFRYNICNYETCKLRHTFLILCLNVEWKRKMATAPYSHLIVMKCIFVTKGALCISKIQQEELGIFYKEILWPQYLKYFITYLVFKIWQFCTAPHSHRTVMKCKLLANEALCISKIQQEELSQSSFWPLYLKSKKVITCLVFKFGQFCTVPHRHCTGTCGAQWVQCGHCTFFTKDASSFANAGPVFRLTFAWLWKLGRCLC